MLIEVDELKCKTTRVLEILVNITLLIQQRMFQEKGHIYTPQLFLHPVQSGDTHGKGGKPNLNFYIKDSKF